MGDVLCAEVAMESLYWWGILGGLGDVYEV